MLKWILLLSSTLLQLTAAGLLPTGHDVGTLEHKEVGLQPPHTFSASLGSHGTKNFGAERSTLTLHNPHSSAEASPATSNARAEGNSGINDYGAKISKPTIDIDIRGGSHGNEGLAGPLSRDPNVQTDNPTANCCGEEKNTAHENIATDTHTSDGITGNDHHVFQSNIAHTPTGAHDITIEPIPLQYHSYQSGHNAFSSGNPGGALSSNFQFTGGSSQHTQSEDSMTGSAPLFTNLNKNHQQSSFSLNSANHEGSFLGGSQNTHGHQQIFSFDSVNRPFSGGSQNIHGQQPIFSVDSVNHGSSTLGSSQNIHGHQQTFSLDTGNHQISSFGGSHDIHSLPNFSLDAGDRDRSFMGGSQNTHGNVMASSVDGHGEKQVNADVKMAQISHQANGDNTQGDYFSQQLHGVQNSDALDHTKLIDGIFRGIGEQREIVPSIGTEIHIGAHNGAHHIPSSPVTHTKQTYVTQTDFRAHPTPNLHVQSRIPENPVEQTSGVFPSYNRNIAPALFSSFRSDQNVQFQGNNNYRGFNRNIMREQTPDTFEGY